jgi:hypothetical protein
MDILGKEISQDSQPSCNTKFIKCKYFISIRPFFEKKVRNDHIQDIIFEIKIFPEKPKFFPSIVHQTDWNPKIENTIFLDFNEKKKISSVNDIFFD